jgi:hypothetical protein
MPESRSQLGKYQLVDKIGEGAMGVVHKAFDPVLNRTLAIKVMSAVIASDTQLRERFLREAQAAGSLQHPNVITVFDFGEIDEHLFIAMEFVEGYDLAHIITKHVPLAVEAKLDILIDTLNGLGYAHSHGVVHRDIKPANIRVTVDGRAKLMDFGIAHMSESNLTKSGEMIGTPQYMAPEQVTGAPITPATDVFSLACVGYELFTNVRPFDGETLHAVLFNIVSNDPRPITVHAPSLPPDLDAVFATALAKDPAQRFESAAAMAHALAHVRQSIAPGRDMASLVVRSAARESALPTTLKSRRTVISPAARQGLRGAGIGGVAVALVALAVWAPWKGGAAPATASPPAPPGKEAPTSAPTTPIASGADGSGAAPNPAAPPTTALPAPPPPTASPAPAGTQVARATVASAADTILASMRAAALSTRRDAVAAGATSVELSEGDLELQAADGLTARSRPTDAISRLSAASQRWRAAEQAARDRAVAADARRAEPVSAPLPTPPAVVSQPVSTPPAAVSAAPRPATASESRAEIDRVIKAYEEAIESEDIARIRRAYPGMTAPQQANWEAFFRAARNLRATFTTTSFDPAEDRAIVAIDAIYEYDNRSTSRAERNALQLRMTVTRDEAGAWRLTAVR